MPTLSLIATLNRVTVRDLVYRVYERRLLRSLAGKPHPRHVGVLCDGNRRWAREMGYVDPNDGHRVGAERIKDLVRWCDQAGVEHVTLWLLSTDNLSRPAAELDPLLRIIENKKGRASRQIFNLGNPKNDVSVAQLARLIIAAFKDFPDYHEHMKRARAVVVPSDKYFGRYYQDIQRRRPSIAHAKKQLGWTPKVNLKQAIKLTLDYHLAHKDYRLE